ncbi:MAG TPA: gliding motility-associated C-terminal domain-containing protein, partial [Chitinophagaceae bacterium]|nr:gliding motility-associated C-terminal domain-containing protein [Chitinophagaceae bacterium]
GNYTIQLKLTDTIGCSDSFSHFVHIQDAPFVTFEVSDSIVCLGDPIFFNDSMNIFTQSTTWDFGDGLIISNVSDLTHTYDMAGLYTVTLTGTNLKCAPSQFSIPIEVKPYPNINLGKDTMICPGITSSILLADINNPSAIYLWNTGETTNSISVTEPGRYWAMATTANSTCSTTDSIWIKRDCYLNIPNSFSPNGDGRNDYFLPRELLSSGLSSFTMDIYNRWGENIFTTDKIDGRGWDGKYNGIDQPFGVFVYIINAKFNNNISKTFTGNITLIR